MRRTAYSSDELISRARQWIKWIGNEKKESFACNLPVTVAAADATAMTMEYLCRTTPAMENPWGATHGGMTAMLMDWGMGIVSRVMLNEANTHTVSMLVNYLRPVPIGQELRMKVSVKYAGRTIVTLYAELGAEGDPFPLANATGTYYMIGQPITLGSAAEPPAPARAEATKSQEVVGMRIGELKKIAVIGAGDMGHGIAQMGLMSGYEVNLCDIKQEFVDRGISRIYASLDKLQEKGKIEAAEVDAIKNGRLNGFVSIADAVKDVDFVMEVVPERMDIKLSTLAAIDAAAPAKAVIGSNTSTMSITKLATATTRPDKVFGMHYFNPVVLMRLVEVIKGDGTSEETANFACDYVNRIGKTLIFARKDTPGFIANRIAAPVIMYNGLMLDKEHFDPADIDLSMMKIGQKMGPMELADYSGVDVMAACQDYYHEHLSPEYGSSDAAKALLAAKHFGRKSGQGYYTWPEKGRPVLDESKFTGKYDTDIPFFIQANEACKLLEDGVCTLEECDTAMEYGYNTQGPVAYIQKYEPAYIAQKLTEIAQKYGCEIFKPTQTIISGKYKR